MDDNEIIECPVCTEYFTSTDRQPKALTCIHTICLNCLRRLHTQHGKTLDCPMCRKPQTLPDDPATLPNNPLAMDLVARYEEDMARECQAEMKQQLEKHRSVLEDHSANVMINMAQTKKQNEAIRTSASQCKDEMKRVYALLKDNIVTRENHMLAQLENHKETLTNSLQKEMQNKMDDVEKLERALNDMLKTDVISQSEFVEFNEKMSVINDYPAVHREHPPSLSVEFQWKASIDGIAGFGKLVCSESEIPTSPVAKTTDEQMKDLKAENSKLITRLKELEIENNTIVVKMRQLESHRNDQAIQLQQLEYAKEWVSDKAALSTDVEKQNAIPTSKKLTTKVQHLEDEKEKLTATSNEMTAKVKHLEDENQQLMAASKEMVKQVKHLEDEKQKLMATSKRMTTNFNHVEDEKQQLMTTLKEMTTKIKHIEEEKEQLMATSKEMTTKFKHVEDEKQQLTETSKEMTAKVKHLEDKMQQLIATSKDVTTEATPLDGDRKIKVMPKQTVQSTLSSASNSKNDSLESLGSTDLTTYQGTLDGVFAWLLESEETLKVQGIITTEEQSVKDQFHQHEDFMLRLTKHQGRVGSVIKEGNRLLQEGGLAEQDGRRIETQMGLVNNRWEELQMHAMDRESSLSKSVMELQQQQLESLSDWLSSVEKRISNYSIAGTDIEAVQKQVEQHQELQQEVKLQQEQVHSLHNMVVVVDETNCDTAYMAIEQKLELQGQRWARVCKWVEEQWALLQEILIKWQYFHQEMRKFIDWLTQKENILAPMRLADLTDISEIVKQVKELKAIETNMDIQIRHLDDLNECGKELVQFINNDPDAVTRINSQLQEFQERWDNLVQQMEYQSKEIANAGVEVKVNKGTGGSQTITITKRMEGINNHQND